MAKYIMALDQGTTSSRCILFDRDARIASLAIRASRSNRMQRELVVP